MSADPIRWIAPLVRRNALEWVDPCEGELVTPQVLQYRKQHGLAPTCANRAKVDYRGRKLCVRHARMVALTELAGEMPDFQTQQAQP